MADTNTTVTLKDLAKYFGYAKLSDFSKDWQTLTDQDKKDIKSGVADGTFNY